MQLTKFGWGRGRKWEAGKSTSRCAEKKTAESQQHSHSKQTSNIIKHTERDTLISLALQEASIFRKSSKCKLIYYRKRSRGTGVQPNSRHQRVKPKTLQLSQQRQYSPGEFISTPSHARTVPPSTNGQTNRHDQISHYHQVHYPTHGGECVCAGISSSLRT